MSPRCLRMSPTFSMYQKQSSSKDQNMSMGDPWLQSFDACDRLSQEIMENITHRNRQPRGSSTFTKESAHIRTDMMKFSADVDSLKQDLVRAGTLNRLTMREADRRQSMIDQLLSKQKRLERAVKQEDNMGQRSDLMGPLGSLDQPWGQERSSGMMEESNNPFTSLGDIRQQQQQVIRDQDAGLDALSQVLGRQRQMAVDIGTEVDTQNELIDDITDHVDTTHTRLIRETKHVRLIDKKSNTCAMWVVIVLLFITILVIAIIPKSKL